MIKYRSVYMINRLSTFVKIESEFIREHVQTRSLTHDNKNIFPDY